MEILEGVRKMISIILPIYIIDRELLDITYKFFDSLEKYTKREDYQLIVVDNGSRFGSDFLKRKANVYIHKDKPMGYARAVNCGVTLADYDRMVIVNNDIELSEVWLDTLKQDYDLYGPGVLAPFDFPAPPGIYKDHHWYSLIMTDKKTWQTVGYLDETLNYRFHDQDYSIRLKMAGFEVMRTANVVVKHINSATYSKMGRNEDPEEEKEMIKRYGAAHFQTWLQNQK